MITLQKIGYFDESELPYYLTQAEPIPDVDRICSYLQNGVKIYQWLGHSSCVFNCGIPDDQMGSCDITDGVWIWPQGLYHYVEYHHIMLPEPFVDHLFRNNFKLEIEPHINNLLQKNINNLESNDIQLNSVLWDKWIKDHRSKNTEENSRYIAPPYKKIPHKKPGIDLLDDWQDP